ncbi:MAG TPA: IclR family transcriptional regulator [Syntrophorhabdaceae bacterium]|nr:IclR family transcriptional regulator [Syntrophorhabdaceae bacterium]
MKSSKKKQKKSYSQFVPAVEQATRILQYLSSSSGLKANLTSICKYVGIHASKGYALLNTLQKSGYVNRDQSTKLYSLGLSLIWIGQKALEGVHVKEVAKPFLEGLAGETHSTALFGMIAADQIVIVGKHDPDHDVGVTLRLGYAVPLTYSAPGKAIVAFLPEREQKELLGGSTLFFHGEYPSDLDRQKLTRELDECRRIGYAKAPGKGNPLVRVLASPVLGPTAYPLGVLFVIGIFPESIEASYGGKIAEAARQLSAILGSDATWPSAEAVEHAARVHGRKH